MKRQHILLGSVRADNNSIDSDLSWAAILEEARHRPHGIMVTTLGDKAEEDGQYPSGSEFTVKKVPSRTFIIKPR